MHEKMTVKSILIEKDNFTVTVYPNIDYAFCWFLDPLKHNWINLGI